MGSYRVIRGLWIRPTRNTGCVPVDICANNCHIQVWLPLWNSLGWKYPPSTIWFISWLFDGVWNSLWILNQGWLWNPPCVLRQTGRSCIVKSWISVLRESIRFSPIVLQGFSCTLSHPANERFRRNGRHYSGPLGQSISLLSFIEGDVMTIRRR